MQRDGVVLVHAVAGVEEILEPSIAREGDAGADEARGVGGVACGKDFGRSGGGSGSVEGADPTARAGLVCAVGEGKVGLVEGDSVLHDPDVLQVAAKVAFIGVHKERYLRLEDVRVGGMWRCGRETDYAGKDRRSASRVNLRQCRPIASLREEHTPLVNLSYRLYVLEAGRPVGLALCWPIEDDIAEVGGTCYAARSGNQRCLVRCLLWGWYSYND